MSISSSTDKPMRRESGKKEVCASSFQIHSHDCAFSVKLSAQCSLGAYEPRQYLFGIATLVRAFIGLRLLVVRCLLLDVA